MVGTELRGDVAVESWVKLEVDPPRVGALRRGLLEVPASALLHLEMADGLVKN
jgi:hypothetical protein